MRRISALLVTVLLIVFSSCGPSKVKSMKEIATLEKRLYSGPGMNFNKPRADSLLLLYEQFVKRFPKDTLAPKYLFQAGGLAMTLGDGKKSLALYEDFMQRFPDNPKTPACLFFRGYVYENLMANYDKAKETYLLFIEKYPENEFAKDARIALMNVGKTPEQLVREFEEKQKAEKERISDSLASIQGKKHKRSGN